MATYKYILMKNEIKDNKHLFSIPIHLFDNEHDAKTILQDLNIHNNTDFMVFFLISIRETTYDEFNRMFKNGYIDYFNKINNIT